MCDYMFRPLSVHPQALKINKIDITLAISVALVIFVYKS